MEWTFDFTGTPAAGGHGGTGAPVDFTVPAGVTSLKVKLAGGCGGNGKVGQGGGGASFKTIMPVSPGDVLQIFVGGRGENRTNIGGGGGGASAVINLRSHALEVLAGGGGGGGFYGDRARGEDGLQPREAGPGNGGAAGDPRDGGGGGGGGGVNTSGGSAALAGGGGSTREQGTGGSGRPRPDFASGGGYGLTGGGAGGNGGGGGGGYEGGRGGDDGVTCAGHGGVSFCRYRVVEAGPPHEANGYVVLKSD